ncbi:MAG: cytochrome c-type biogenesis protein CcmH [Aeromicrobium sp.]|nr:cytochrome c-type biogenesis protein CcmH [Burkholderiales bacterium]
MFQPLLSPSLHATKLALQGNNSHRKSLESTGIFKHLCLEKSAEWRVWCFATLNSARVTAARLVFGLLLIGSASVQAQVQSPEPPPPSTDVAKRLKTLESELRCLVCQNQTLAESPSGLAGDLRREVRSLVEQGKTDAEVKIFLRARYGDFVLYKPPVDPKTYLLWYGPFGLLFIGAVSGWMITRRRGLAAKVSPQADALSEISPSPQPSQSYQASQASHPSHASYQQARALLDDDGPVKDEKR